MDPELRSAILAIAKVAERIESLFTVVSSPQNDKPVPEYVSRDGAAKALGVSPRSIDRFAASGSLTKYRIGSRTRFKLEEVLSLFT